MVTLLHGQVFRRDALLFVGQFQRLVDLARAHQAPDRLCTGFFLGTCGRPRLCILIDAQRTVILVHHIAHHVEHDQREIHGHKVDHRQEQPRRNQGREEHTQRLLARHQEEEEGAEAEVGQADHAHH